MSRCWGWWAERANSPGVSPTPRCCPPACAHSLLNGPHENQHAAGCNMVLATGTFCTAMKEKPSPCAAQGLSPVSCGCLHSDVPPPQSAAPGSRWVAPILLEAQACVLGCSPTPACTGVCAEALYLPCCQHFGQLERSTGISLLSPVGPSVCLTVPPPWNCPRAPTSPLPQEHPMFPCALPTPPLTPCIPSVV